MDLAIDEVTTISEIIQDAAGEDAEIIFGAVHDPNMSQEVRVTVIATGFERSSDRSDGVIRPRFGGRQTEPQRQVISQPNQQQQVRVVGGGTVTGGPPAPQVERSPTLKPIDFRMPADLEIPTFIRRQMD
jgi:cell division protein FtsZ